MNILIVTPVIPYPLSEGGKISQFAAINSLRTAHRIKLVLITRNAADEQNVNHLRKIWPEVKINTISQAEEESGSSAVVKFAIFVKGLLIKTLRYKKIQPVGINNPYKFNLCDAKNKGFILLLNKILKEDKIDIAQVEFVEFIDLALAFPDDVKKVFVHHEIFFARVASEIRRHDHDKSVYDDYALAYVKNREINFLKLYDAILTFSDDDRRKLIENVEGMAVYNTPFPILDKNFIPSPPDFKVNKIVFVGPEEHYPNREAVEWYLSEIAPLVKVKTNMPLHVIGKWNTETIDSYKQNDAVVFTGFVEDLTEYCKDSLMVVPVRIGSGIRSKILYAMAQSIPVVSTSLGCEGINVADEENILVADTAIDFSDAIVRLIDDNALALQIAQKGHEMVKQYYSEQAFVAQRSKCYEEILSA